MLSLLPESEARHQPDAHATCGVVPLDAGDLGDVLLGVEVDGEVGLELLGFAALVAVARPERVVGAVEGGVDGVNSILSAGRFAAVAFSLVSKRLVVRS